MKLDRFELTYYDMVRTILSFNTCNILSFDVWDNEHSGIILHKWVGDNLSKYGIDPCPYEPDYGGETIKIIGVDEIE